MGNTGKVLVEIFLCVSQTGFTLAYVYFISSNLHDVILDAFNYEINIWYFGIFCAVVYCPLCFVRKIEKFAWSHLLADVLILITIVTCVYYSIDTINTQGVAKVNAVTPHLFFNMIGFAAYNFEGVGLILPIYDIQAKPEMYKTVTLLCVITVVVISVGFGEVCLFAYGANMQANPIITYQLPSGNVWVYIVKLLFCINLLFSYPLQIHPVNVVIESYLFKGWPKSKKRQNLKNLSRSIMVVFTVVVALTLGANLGKFLSILGAMGCTPIAFTLPALFHYKIVAKTTFDKAVDIAILIFSGIIFVFCTFWTIYTWDSQ